MKIGLLFDNPIPRADGSYSNVENKTICSSCKTGHSCTDCHASVPCPVAIYNTRNCYNYGLVNYSDVHGMPLNVVQVRYFMIRLYLPLIASNVGDRTCSIGGVGTVLLSDNTKRSLFPSTRA